MKTINYVLIFVGLFILDILYSTLVISLIQKIGFNITDLSLINKYIVIILIDISLMFILYLIYRKELNHEFSKYLKNFKNFFSFGLKYWALGLAIMMISNFIIQFIYPSVASNEQAVQEALLEAPIYIAFSSCIFAPFAEEIIFRKALRKIFNNNLIFIIVSGIIFGLVHNLTSLSSGQILYIIPYGTFGVIFAYMYVKTNSIFVPMTFHFIHNTILVFISLMSTGVI